MPGGDAPGALEAHRSRRPAAAAPRARARPAGSGDTLRAPPGGLPFVDGLIHGRRRWFFIGPDAFERLRADEAALEALEPSSACVRDRPARARARARSRRAVARASSGPRARSLPPPPPPQTPPPVLTTRRFVFFENQLDELREDAGSARRSSVARAAACGARARSATKLKAARARLLPPPPSLSLSRSRSRSRYVEALQRAGDALYVPADVVFTSLSYDDSFSYREHAAGAADEAAARARGLWAPDGGRVPQNYRAAACFGLDVAAPAAALGGAGAPMAGIDDQVCEGERPRSPRERSLSFSLSLRARNARTLSLLTLEGARAHRRAQILAQMFSSKEARASLALARSPSASQAWRGGGGGWRSRNGRGGRPSRIRSAVPSLSSLSRALAHSLASRCAGVVGADARDGTQLLRETPCAALWAPCVRAPRRACPPARSDCGCCATSRRSARACAPARRRGRARAPRAALSASAQCALRAGAAPRGDERGEGGGRRRRRAGVHRGVTGGGRMGGRTRRPRL